MGIREAHPGGTPRGVPGFDRRAARRVAWSSGDCPMPYEYANNSDDTAPAPAARDVEDLSPDF